MKCVVLSKQLRIIAVVSRGMHRAGVLVQELGAHVLMCSCHSLERTYANIYIYTLDVLFDCFHKALFGGNIPCVFMVGSMNLVLLKRKLCRG